MRQNSILIQKADKLAHEIYRISRQFPKEELFGLISQIRRAVISIPLNAIEGFARQSEKEYRRFLEISYGSLKEVKYLLYFVMYRKVFFESRWMFNSPKQFFLKNCFLVKSIIPLPCCASVPLRGISGLAKAIFFGEKNCLSGLH